MEIKILSFQEKYNVVVVPLVVEESIENNDLHDILKRFRSIPDKSDLLIILHVPEGGSADICSRICKIINKHKGNVCVFVPETAMSCGSQIALMGDKLLMGKHACLSPIDDQLDEIPAKEMKSIRKIIKRKTQKNSALVSMVSLSLEDYANIIESKRMLKITRQEITEVLKHKYSKKVIKKVMEMFIDHKKYHSYPIYAKDLKSIGMDIDTNVKKDYYDLFETIYEEKITKEKKTKKKD